MVVSIPFASEAAVLLVLAAALVLMVFQSQPVSRRRVIASILFVVVAVGCKVLADGDVPIMNPCRDIEPYSVLWWFLGCWSLPG